MCRGSCRGRSREAPGRSGLEVDTDGEMHRESFQSQLIDAAEGFGEQSIDPYLWRYWRCHPQGKTLWGYV
jgi:hypothetical protein